MIRIAFSILVFAMSLVAQDRSPVDIIKDPVPPAKRIPYGTDPLQFGELRVPSGKGPYPVVEIVHGGCWVAKLGNLDEHIVALDLVRPIAAALTAMGIATWNIEYRRLGNPGGGWPGSFEDVARGTDYLRKIARENNLDLARVVTMGHSAGGHFAIWLAARPKIPSSSELYSKDPLPIRGVVDLDGPGDLKATIAIQQPVCGAPVVTQLLGGTPEEHPERYRAASPIEMLPIGVPQESFASRMFAGQAPAYEEAAKRAGDTVHTVILPNAGHFVFIDPKSSAWPEVVRRTKDLLGIQ